MPTTLVVADDHPILLSGLETLFSLDPELNVLAWCERGADVVPAVHTHSPDVLVLDLRMPDVNGMKILAELQAFDLKTKIVLLTAEVSEDDMIEAARLGVRGVVLKETAPNLLVKCIHKVAAGGYWLETRTAALALEKAARREGATRDLRERLTQRELEIVRAVTDGLRNREIAEQLRISEGTVKMHLHNIYEKLAVRSRMQLSVYAREHEGAIGRARRT